MTLFDKERVIRNLEAIITSCLLEDTLIEWKEYMEEHKSLFVEESRRDPTVSADAKNATATAVSGSGGSRIKEFSHEQYSVYEGFIALVERRISRFASEYDNMSLEQFFEACREHSSVPSVDVFNSIIVLTTQFQAFADVVSDEGKRRYMFDAINAWKQYFAAAPSKK